MALIKYQNWQESSAFTRNRREVALGLKPLASLGGNVNSHSTARAWETKSIEKKSKSQKKKKPSKSADSNNLDSWLKEVDALEGDLAKLKKVYDKKRKKVAEKPIKPEKAKSTEKSNDDPKEKDEKEKKPEKPEKNPEEKNKSVTPKPSQT